MFISRSLVSGWRFTDTAAACRLHQHLTRYFAAFGVNSEHQPQVEAYVLNISARDPPSLKNFP